MKSASDLFPIFKTLTDVRVFQPGFFNDERGDLWTLWEKGQFYDLSFNHDKVSTSRRGVIRGIHGDNKSYKLITCLYGEIYLVVVDNRPDSPTYLKYESIFLDNKNKFQVLVPPNFGNGFLVLSNEAVFHYKWAYQGEYPDVKDQFTLKWNDPRIGINWPLRYEKFPILSERDK
jgi:dTDP-4-dehydrorhamnose 3,5-epimerase